MNLLRWFCLIVMILLLTGGVIAQSQTPTPDGAACSPDRVRKDAKTLTAEEKTEFVETLHAMKATLSPYDSRYTYYDQFVRWHQLSVQIASSHEFVGAHHNPLFAPWHRWLLFLFENALCEVSGNPEMALPYWDWTDPESTAAVFTVDFMSPGGDPEHGYAVTEGPFRKDIWQLNLLPSDPNRRAQSPHKYLVRALGVDTGNLYPILLPTIVDVHNTLQSTGYDVPPYSFSSENALSFRNTLEGFTWDESPDTSESMHNIVHDWVAGVFITDLNGRVQVGSMEPLDVSPNDPVFFLHHANVDRVWATWQINYPGAENYQPNDLPEPAPCPDAPDPGPNNPLVIHNSGDHAMTEEQSQYPLGMGIDDLMYPFCLSEYEGTIVWEGLTPRDQLSLEALGYRYDTYRDYDPTAPN
ncbi:MAG: tyrosinase family protein [Anaerolineae bacterium]|jgi:tyrosinase|nr:tyrosinase family protein [Anaerolineae bacterium]